MATDPRAALERLVAALHAHLDAAEAAGDPEADPVLDATVALADAFDTYDEALYEATGVDTPLYLEDDDFDEDEDEDEEDEDEEDEDDEAAEADEADDTEADDED
jgi:hypothetical protein